MQIGKKLTGLGVLSLIVTLCIPAIPAHATRGIEVSLPAYAWPNDTFLTDIIDPVKTPVPPAVVVLNKSGDVSELDANSDALRAREGAYGGNVKTVGYVNTRNWVDGVGMTIRPAQDIKNEIDTWLVRQDDQVHYDGIFFDQTPRECGANNAYRDVYRDLREYVQQTIPEVEEVVVNNPGTAVEDCYLEAGHETADIFVTFEGTKDTYYQTPSPTNGYVGYTGGNVFNGGGYRPGTEYDSWHFWHLVYDTDSTEAEGVVQTAYDRYAGHVDATDDNLTGLYLNPWDLKPTYLNNAIEFAGSLPL